MLSLYKKLVLDHQLVQCVKYHGKEGPLLGMDLGEQVVVADNMRQAVNF